MIVNGWEIRYGRSYELDKNEPGSATVTIIDLTGECDPTSSGFLFNPGTPMAIALYNPITQTQHPRFKGHVASCSYDLYQTEEYAVCTVELVDGLDRLAKMEMTQDAGFGSVFTAEANEGDVWFDVDTQVADRINSVLDSCEWPSGAREIFSGNVALKDVSYAYRTSALTAILDAVDAEFPGVANFYIQHAGANAGKATFHGRLARFKPLDVQYHITTWDCGDEDSGADALIFSLTYDVDTSRIINDATATPKDIVDSDIAGQTTTDPSSIAQYGRRTESWADLLTDEDHFDGADDLDATLRIASYYVSNYAEPRTRVNTVTFKGINDGSQFAAGTWALMCGVDISDRIALTTTHFGGVGGFLEHFYVEGVRIRKGPHELDVEVELDLSPTAYYQTNPWEF